LFVKPSKTAATGPSNESGRPTASTIAISQLTLTLDIYPNQWKRLQRFAVPIPSETPLVAKQRQCVFYYCLFPTIVTFELYSDRKAAAFLNLLTTAEQAQTFDGLESMFVSLLCDAIASEGASGPSVMQATALWGQFSNKVSSDIAWYFLYDYIGDRLGFFSPADMASLRGGGSHASQIAAGADGLLKFASSVTANPFEQRRTGQAA
jgi:hypothetical protein